MTHSPTLGSPNHTQYEEDTPPVRHEQHSGLSWLIKRSEDSHTLVCGKNEVWSPEWTYYHGNKVAS